MESDHLSPQNSLNYSVLLYMYKIFIHPCVYIISYGVLRRIALLLAGVICAEQQQERASRPRRVIQRQIVTVRYTAVQLIVSLDMCEIVAMP